MPDNGEIPDDQQKAINTTAWHTVSGNPQELDYTPRAEDYRIGIADSLEISVFRSEALSAQVQVDSEGNVSLPLIGSIPAMGISKSDLERRIEDALRQRYMHNPKVTIFIKDSISQRITVDGWVAKPGVYPIVTGQVSVLQAVAMAGGAQEFGDIGNVVLLRKTSNQTKSYQLDVNAIRNGKMRDPFLRNNDVIIVNRADARYLLRETASVFGNIFGIARPFNN